MTNVWKAAGVAGGMTVLGLGLYYPLMHRDMKPAAPAIAAPQVPESKPMSTEENIRLLLPTLDEGEASARKTALDAISAALKSKDEKGLTPETREETARALIGLYGQTEGVDAESAGIKVASLRVMMTQVGGQTAKDFVQHVLATEPDEARLQALKIMLEPGSVRGGELSAKALELTRSELVPAELKPALLRRFLGKKSEGEIVAILQTSTDTRVLSACAVQLQNLGRPEVMGQVLAKLDEHGLIKDARTMPWFSGKVLNEHIKTAEGEDLVRALRVVWLRPSLTRTTMKAAQERIAHADPQVRRIVARLVPDAVKYEGLDAPTGEHLLAARLEIETDPSVKGEIEGSLAQVRQAQKPVEAPVAPVTQ